MNLLEYQSLASRTEKPLDRSGRLQHGMLGVISEAGKLADTVKKHVIYGQSLDIANLDEELGDLLWYLALIANATGINLQHALEHNIAKQQKRYPEKYTDQAAAQRADKVEIEQLPSHLKGLGE